MVSLNGRNAAPAKPATQETDKNWSEPTPRAKVGEVSARPSAKALTRDCDDPNPNPDLSPDDLDID